MKKATFNTLAAITLLSTTLASTVSLAQQQKPTPVPVEVQSVKESSLASTTDIVGTVYSRSDIQLTAGISGQVDWIAEPGTFLQAGDSVATMDMLPLELELAEQKAVVKRSTINQAYLKREYERLSELRNTNSASIFQLDQTRSQYQLSQADLEIADLKLKQIQDRIERATVKAPFAGVITQRLRRSGNDVNRSDVLVKILDTENLEVRLFVPVKYLSALHGNREVTLTDGRSQTNAGISAIIPAADPRSQTFELRIALPQTLDDVWTAGQLITVRLPIADSQQALMVHRDALILRRDGTYVVTIDENNTAKRTPVVVGKGQGDWVSVSGDIKAGDRVATRGAERITDGREVVVQQSAG